MGELSTKGIAVTVCVLFYGCQCHSRLVGRINALEKDMGILVDEKVLCIAVADIVS